MVLFWPFWAVWKATQSWSLSVEVLRWWLCRFERFMLTFSELVYITSDSAQYVHDWNNYWYEFKEILGTFRLISVSLRVSACSGSRSNRKMRNFSWSEKFDFWVNKNASFPYFFPEQTFLPWVDDLASLFLCVD